MAGYVRRRCQADATTASESTLLACLPFGKSGSAKSIEMSLQDFRVCDGEACPSLRNRQLRCDTPPLGLVPLRSGGTEWSGGRTRS